MFVAVADSPCDGDELKRTPEAVCDTPIVTSRPSEEMSTVYDVQSSLSQVSLHPFEAGSLLTNIHPVKTTTSGPALSDSLTIHAAVSLYSPASGAKRTESCHKVAQRQVAQSASIKTPLNTAIRGLQSALSVDVSFSDDRRNSPSPEIDILPVVRRARATSEYGSDSSGSVFGVTKSLQCARSNTDSRHDLSAMEPREDLASVRKCGSPGLGEDGEFVRHKPTHIPATVATSQSAAVGGVKLIPLSQVMPTSPAASKCSVKISHVAESSTEAAGNKLPQSRRLLRSSPTLGEKTEPVQLPKVGRRQSTRRRVPKSILGRAKPHPDDEMKAVKFDISVCTAEPKDKENVCVQRAVETEQQAVPSQQTLQEDSRERRRPSTRSRTSSGNSSITGEESDASLTEVRRSFIKCARLDAEHADKQRLPTSWERHTNKSPATDRRMSDRVKRRESDAISTQQNECDKSSSPVTGRKRQASSSSGLSSGEKKSPKKVIRSIAMTSLHSKWV